MPAPRLTPDEISLVRHHFVEITRRSGQKCRQMKCRHCNWAKAENTTRQAIHLRNCRSFRDVRRTQGGSPMPPRQPNVLEQLNHRMGLTKDELDELAAKTVFVDCLRPEALHKTGMLAFLQALRQPNSSYKPPSRSTILEAWLPRIYEDVRKKVLDEVIAPASMLNVIFDASDDASGHRQVNISIATPEYPAVFWTLVDTGSTRHAAP